MAKAIALFASARRDGNTGQLIDRIANQLDIKVVDLSEKKISPYDYAHKNINDDFIPLVNTLLHYDQIIFATPVYWYSPSAQMKIFIDRTSDFLDVENLSAIGRQLRNKTAYIVCTSISREADDTFLSVFTKTFAYLGMHYGGYIHANCEEGYIQENYQSDVDKFCHLISHQ